MFSLSKGREPHKIAYNITPQLHMSTSGPAYNFPEITWKNSKEKKKNIKIRRKLLIKVLLIKISNLWLKHSQEKYF